ncbi:MAG: AAA family ATPase, partial [Candidatus Aenigmatarchaeota archaeon]
LARYLANEMDMRLVSSGDYFREEARKRNMTIQEFIENMDDIGEREGVDFDIRFDRKILEIAFKRKSVVFEGRMAGVLLNDVADVKVLV